MPVFLGFDRVFIVTRSFGRCVDLRPAPKHLAANVARVKKYLRYPWQLETEKIRFGSHCDVV